MADEISRNLEVLRVFSESLTKCISDAFHSLIYFLRRPARQAQVVVLFLFVFVFFLGGVVGSFHNHYTSIFFTCTCDVCFMFAVFVLRISCVILGKLIKIFIIIFIPIPVSASPEQLICIMMTSSNGNIFRVTGPLCGEFTGPGEFPTTQRPVTRSFDVFFDLRLNKRLSKQPRGWRFETPSWSLWRQCNDIACVYNHVDEPNSRWPSFFRCRPPVIYMLH